MENKKTTKSKTVKKAANKKVSKPRMVECNVLIRFKGVKEGGKIFAKGEKATFTFDRYEEINATIKKETGFVALEIVKSEVEE